MCVARRKLKAQKPWPRGWYIILDYTVVRGPYRAWCRADIERVELETRYGEERISIMKFGGENDVKQLHN